MIRTSFEGRYMGIVDDQTVTFSDRETRTIVLQFITMDESEVYVRVWGGNKIERLVESLKTVCGKVLSVTADVISRMTMTKTGVPSYKTEFRLVRLEGLQDKFHNDPLLHTQATTTTDLVHELESFAKDGKNKDGEVR